MMPGIITDRPTIKIRQAATEQTVAIRLRCRRFSCSASATRRLTAATLGSRCGEARFYLSSVRETDEGLEIVFNYCLNGSVVLLEEDAARFFIKNGRVIQFWMNFRSYTDTGKTSVVMPVPQAMAAMEAKHLEGKELLLMYTDTGGETAAASWVAVDSAPGEA